MKRIALVLVAAAIAGLGIVWAIVSLATAYQVRSPSHMQGRVAAAANTRPFFKAVPPSLRLWARIASSASATGISPNFMEALECDFLHLASRRKPGPIGRSHERLNHGSRLSPGRPFEGG